MTAQGATADEPLEGHGIRRVDELMAQTRQTASGGQRSGRTLTDQQRRKTTGSTTSVVAPTIDATTRIIGPGLTEGMNIIGPSSELQTSRTGPHSQSSQWGADAYRNTGRSSMTGSEQMNGGYVRDRTVNARNVIGDSSGTWGPWAMVAPELQKLVGDSGVLGTQLQYGPNRAAQASPELQALMGRAIGTQPQGSQYLETLIGSAVSDAGMQAAMRGRFGSGAHMGHVARNVAPVLQQELSRVAQERMQQQQLGMQAGQMQLALDRERRGDQAARFDFDQRQGIESWQRRADALMGLARLGGTSYDSGRTDTGELVERETMRNFSDKKFGTDTTSAQDFGARSGTSGTQFSARDTLSGLSRSGRTDTSQARTAEQVIRDITEQGERRTQVDTESTDDASRTMNSQEFQNFWSKADSKTKKGILETLFGGGLNFGFNFG